MSTERGPQSAGPSLYGNSKSPHSERSSLTSEATTTTAFAKMKSPSPIVFNSHVPPTPMHPITPRQFSYYGVLTPSPAVPRIPPSHSVPVPRKEDAAMRDNINFKTPSSEGNGRSIPPVITNNTTNSSINSSFVQSSPTFVNQAPHQLSPGYASTEHKGIKSSGKHSTQYMMSDGRIICGKGLGRGRPGIKRGPRKSSLASELSDDASNTIVVTPPAIDTQQPVPVKRKRTDSEVSIVKSSETASTPISKESTPEYNPTPTQTRSGRQSQKPVPIMAPTSANASPAKRPSNVNTSSPAVKKHPKIKAKVYRGREQFALCEHCLRGNGPLGNVIVFCDACNKCWHQNCHNPRISKEVVADSKAQWFCAECDRILHGKKKSKPQAQTQVKPEMPATTVPAAPPARRFGPPIVGAISLTPPQRREYLNTLSKDKLIDLILRAGDLAPQLPMFESPIPPQAAIPVYTPTPQPQFASSYVTPVDKAPLLAEAELEDEGYDDSFDEHAALYPKPGEGIKLPPESADLHMLLEGAESKTFSHWVRGLPVKTTV